MRALLPLVFALTLSTSAQAVPLPAGARWFVYVPRADQFAKEAEALLTSAAPLAPSLSPRRVNNDLTRSMGLGLVQTETLNASGVDTTQPWMLFERNGSSFLVVSVKSRETFSATLEAWAQARLLKGRDESKVAKPKGGVMVTFSRAQGSKAVAGYLLAGDRAIVLVQSAEKVPALQAAYDAFESAAPVQPGVDGTMQVWLGRESAIRDGWLGIRAQSDGIDVVGAARQIDAGFVGTDAGHADWIRALTAAPSGGANEIPAWARVIAGNKTAAQLFSAMSPLLTPHLSGAGGKSWVDGLRTLAAGPLEVVVTDTDVKAVERAESGGVQEDVLRLTKPSLLFADAPPATLSSTVKQASTALCKAKSLSEEIVRATCSDPALTVGRQGKSLFLGWTGALTKPTPPPNLSGGPSMSCAKGTPIASVRLSPSVVGTAMREVGLLSAMSSQSLAGMLAIGSEYGRLMRASQPAIGLACLEPSGRVTMQGRWRFGQK